MLLSKAHSSCCLSLAGEQMLRAGNPRGIHKQPQSTSPSPCQAANRPRGTLVCRRCPLPARTQACTGCLEPSWGRNHTFCLKNMPLFFVFMLHRSFNKDTNMQSSATCQQELRRERSNACQWSAGREALGKGPGDALPVRTAPQRPPHALSLPAPTDFLAFLSPRAAGHPLQLGREPSLEPHRVQTVPPLARTEAAARVEDTKCSSAPKPPAQM